MRALALPHEERVVDVPGGEQKSPAFLRLNSRGQVPVLVDEADDLVLPDAQAILVYLAQRFDRDGTWLGRTPREVGKVIAWLSFAANEIQHGPHRARLHYLLGAPMAIAEVQEAARAALAIVEDQLARSEYLVGPRPTLADLAVYPCVGLAPEGRVSLEPFAATRAWIARMQAQPFHVAMPGLGAPSPL